MNAAELMTRFVVTVLPTATLAEVARTLSEHAISGVPVCEADGTLVGIISEGDLIRPLARGEHRRFEGQSRAREIMRSEVVSAAETTSVRDIVAAMIAHEIKRVPIVRDGRLVGIVTRADLVKTMVHRPEALFGEEG
jgi:CBS domain-containing protein